MEPIIRSFYTRVLADPDFSAPFQRVDLNHHVSQQMDFLGFNYDGGDEKLFKMHKLFAKEFMDHEGSGKWIHHMNEAIKESDMNDKKKSRLVWRINHEMLKYAQQFDFKPILLSKI